MPVRNGLRSAMWWQIGPADISEAEVTGMQRFSLDKPLLLWLWSSSQNSLLLSYWKSYDSVFLCKKISETETQSALHFSALAKKTYFASLECVPVNIWSWSISALRLSFSVWLWHQMNNFAIYEQYICIYIVVCSHTLYQPQKPLFFFLLHFFSVYHVLDHSVLAEPHSGHSSSYCVFTSPRVEFPLISWEFGVGFQQRMHRRRDKKAPDKSSHTW